MHGFFCLVFLLDTDLKKRPAVMYVLSASGESALLLFSPLWSRINMILFQKLLNCFLNLNEICFRMKKNSCN